MLCARSPDEEKMAATPKKPKPKPRTHKRDKDSPLKIKTCDLGVEFNLESMEEELTCPVCLELYADPLMLPCSHSVCKKCLQDILDNKTKKKKSKKDLVLDCPSCRKEVHLNKERLEGLPRNLALENVVIRYTEERSKSIRKSLSLESPVADMLFSPVSVLPPVQVDPFPCTSKALCDLCDQNAPSKAVWHCVQCEVSYCQACFAKYHPRRGALARHKIRQPQDGDSVDKLRHCREHETELAALFCDRCKVLVCHLCVCEGDGTHAGHTVLAPETACKKIKESLDGSKEESDCLLATMLEQKGKIDALLTEIQDSHKDASALIDTQYERLLSDIQQALQADKQAALKALDNAKHVFHNSTAKYLTTNAAKVSDLEDLSRKCHKATLDKKTRKLLERSKEVEPIRDLVQSHQKHVDEITRDYETLVKDKNARSAIAHTTTGFGANLLHTVNTMTSVVAKQPCIPMIISPSPTGSSSSANCHGGRDDVTSPRVSNKCLTTWGFTSTTYTAEKQVTSGTWTVTVERNVGQAGALSSGYLFGLGVANGVLNVKDLVGMSPSSYALVCVNGKLQFSHNGQMEELLTLDALPLTLTLTLNCEHAHYNILSYRVQGSHERQSVGATLNIKKLLNDPASKEFAYPVFTVSQRVKLLFPTCV